MLPKDDNLPYADTFPAGEFVCDKCGRNSYFSLVAVDSQLDNEELEEFYFKVHGDPLPEGASMNWCMHPLTVTCQHCQTEFATFQKLMEEVENEDFDLDEDE